jgi:hypothetical protein
VSESETGEGEVLHKGVEVARSVATRTGGTQFPATEISFKKPTYPQWITFNFWSGFIFITF